MCFYGRGQNLTTGNFYRLKRNPSNPKDDSCIELTENGLVKATMNARLSKLMAPLIDNAIIQEPGWYDGINFDIRGFVMIHSPWVLKTLILL